MELDEIKKLKTPKDFTDKKILFSNEVLEVLYTLPFLYLESDFDGRRLDDLHSFVIVCEVDDIQVFPLENDEGVVSDDDYFHK